ncbi:MAG: aldo/keto reductase [Lentisphaeria bacterium]|nr:aldo/keto reductase [Lentisphaeria bacterium]
MALELPMRVLGRTGIEVTHLGYGSLELRGVTDRAGVPQREMTDKQAETVLNLVLDSGINFVDTANGYGAAEEHIGRYISKRRSEYFLATKANARPWEPDGGAWSEDKIYRNVEESLDRLKTEYVDLLLLHNPLPEDVEKLNLVGALEEMRRQGKTRWIGISTNLPYLSSFAKVEAFDVFQTSYSTLQPEHHDWITKLAEDDRGIVIRTRAAKGEPDILGSLAHSMGITFTTDEERWANFEKANLDELRDVGESRAALILRYTFAHPKISTVIIGALNPDHLKENIQALRKGPLDLELVNEIHRRLSPLGFRSADVI